MAGRSGSTVVRGTAGLLAAAILLSMMPAPVAAAGLLESIFGGLGRAFDSAPPPTQGPPTQMRAYSEPTMAPTFSHPIRRQERIVDGGLNGGFGGPRHAFCVRTCDGRYFPVRAHAGLSVAEACHSFCPACKTRLYYGTTIDYAVARDGSRYADLPNAYLYRKHMVANCSCNGRSAVGLAPMAPKDDPTLRRGDIVATSNGLVAYTGDQANNFTPVQSYAGFSTSERAELSALKVTPPDQRGTAETPVIPSSTAARALGDNRRAQR
jgi:hypothetical protein